MSGPSNVLPEWLGSLVAPHPALKPGEETRRAQALSILSGLCAIVSLLALALLLAIEGRVVAIGLAVAILFSLAYVFSRTRYAGTGVWLVTLGLMIAIALALTGMPDSNLAKQAPALLLLPLILSTLLQPARTTAWLALALVFCLALLMEFSTWNHVGDYATAYAGVALLGVLLAAATLLRERGLIAAQPLQEPAAEQPHLATRHCLAAVTEIGRIITAARDVATLLDQAPGVIVRQFGAAAVEVYFTEERRQTSFQAAGAATVTAWPRPASGGMPPVVTRVLIGGETALLDGAEWAEETPREGRNGVAVPMVVGSRIIGVMVIHSGRLEGFDAVDVVALETIAALMAVAIENLRSLDGLQQDLRDVRRLKGKLAAAGWQDYGAARAGRPVGYRAGMGGVYPIDSGEAMRRPLEGTLELPIRVHGEVAAVLSVSPHAGVGAPDEETCELLQAAAARIAVALESSRLYHEAQRAARRESKAGAIAERLQRAPNLDLLLESAARELAVALGTEDVYAELGAEASHLPTWTGPGTEGGGEAAGS